MKNNLKKLYILLISLLIGIIPAKVFANSLTLNKSETLLGVGYSETLKATITGGLNSSNVIWTSSNESIATVVNGRVTGIRNGTAIITASINSYKATCKVVVGSNYIPVKGISLNKENLNILVGTSETLIKNITPSNATNQDVIWTSSDNNVATVVNGQVTAKKVGKAIITVSSFGYKSTCIVNVVNNIGLKGITINKTSTTIKEHSSENLSITYNPSTATNKKITWRSSNNSIVQVDGNGKITGIKAGSATITAVSNDGGFVSTCKVTVEALSKNVTGVTLDKKELSILAGEKATLKATVNPNYAENKNVTWESSDKTIATVKDGEVTAISPGTVEIKVITEDEKKEAICKVTVTSPPIKSISFKDKNKIVYVGSKTKLITIAEPVNAVIEKPIWTSSNTKVATVTDGIITTLSEGETIITVSNEDKSITASINIKVINKPKEKLSITIEGYDLKFDPNIKNYNLEIGSEKELNIKTNVSEEKATIYGNQNLKNGSIITITIKDKEKTTYIINIKKKENYIIIFIAAISILLLLNLIRILIKKKKKK